ncbi:hypothetical protein [Burkholderia cenocepacia]|uniref:hypothetical protein n=1 Tax=Burkholderia cenocepacia TaxID=95486 RepID=UPI00264C7665|nr:hypothetical protein [Burkholderia cenocepacia]MDN7458154.1 hypothetical protein [Burkholderia cenocepacia]
MLEKTVETYLVDRVRAAGGDAYKFTSPARVSVPDRIVVFPPARIYFVELKRPGGKLTRGQEREHARLRALGCDVRTLDSREAVDAFVREAGARRADALTDERIAHIAAAHTNSVVEFDRFLKFARALLAAFPASQPTAAPIVERIIDAAVDCIRHDVAPDWQRAALRNALNTILAASSASQPAAAPIERVFGEMSAVREFQEWLDARRDCDVSSVFHEIVAKFRAAVEQPAAAPADERAAWDRTRHALAVAMVGFADRPELIRRNLDAAVHVLDALTEPGSPLTWLRTARAASANETNALGYAQRLATSLWQQHWRDTAPQWKVLDDTLGVLTQIDNMVCGLRRAPALTDAQREAIAFAAGWFNQSVLPDTPYGGYVAALRELLAGGAA